MYVDISWLFGCGRMARMGFCDQHWHTVAVVCGVLLRCYVLHLNYGILYHSPFPCLMVFFSHGIQVLVTTWLDEVTHMGNAHADSLLVHFYRWVTHLGNMLQTRSRVETDYLHHFPHIGSSTAWMRPLSHHFPHVVLNESGKVPNSISYHSFVFANS